MLGAAKMVGFVPTADTERAVPFYRDVLGLALIEESPFAAVFDAGGTPVRLTATGPFTPQPFTVLGWEVASIQESVDALAERGVTFSRFDGMDQDDRGVWTSPSGAKVAWFRDPDGNTLSVTEV